jgi:hypothetical protein
MAAGIARDGRSPRNETGQGRQGDILFIRGYIHINDVESNTASASPQSMQQERPCDIMKRNKQKNKAMTGNDSNEIGGVRRQVMKN